MTTNPPPDARNARIYVATANVAVMDILSGREHPWIILATPAMTMVLITQCLQRDFADPIGPHDPLPDLGAPRVQPSGPPPPTPAPPRRRHRPVQVIALTTPR